MENQFLYWPFDEITLAFTEDGEGVLVKSPWMEIKLPREQYHPEAIETLVAKFQDDTVNPGDDLELVHSFFSEFKDYPLSYTLPTPKKGEDEHKLMDNAAPSDSIADFLKSCCAEMNLSDTDFQNALSLLPRQEWSWDIEAACNFATHGDKVHPESVLSVARRFHYLEVAENAQSQEIFEKIEQLTGDDFRRAARIMVRQNHYVTQKCQEALAPAADIAQHAKGEVEEFMKEEQGHDLILGVAMKAMAEDPEQVPVTLQTSILMKLLEKVASRNLLGFAMAVDAFERSSHDKVDPLAGLLEKGGYEKAASQINRHMQINEAGGHDNVAVGFLEWMKPCDKDYAVEALKFAEVITLIMNSVIAASFRLFEEEKSR